MQALAKKKGIIMPSQIQDPMHLKNSCSGARDTLQAALKSLDDAESDLHDILQMEKERLWTDIGLRLGVLLYVIKGAAVTGLSFVSEFGPKGASTVACAGLVTVKLTEQGMDYMSAPGRAGNVLDITTSGLEFTKCVVPNKGAKKLIEVKKNQVALASDAVKYDSRERDLDGTQFAIRLFDRSISQGLDLMEKGKGYETAKAAGKALLDISEQITQIEKDIASSRSSIENAVGAALRRVEAQQKRLKKALLELKQCKADMNSSASPLT